MRIENVFRLAGTDKGVDFILYLLQHTNADTKLFNVPYAKIQKELNISQMTIARYFKTLEENGTIIRAGRGKWFVPAVICFSDSADGPEAFVESKFKPN